MRGLPRVLSRLQFQRWKPRDQPPALWLQFIASQCKQHAHKFGGKSPVCHSSHQHQIPTGLYFLPHLQLSCSSTAARYDSLHPLHPARTYWHQTTSSGLCPARFWLPPAWLLTAPIAPAEAAEAVPPHSLQISLTPSTPEPNNLCFCRNSMICSARVCNQQPRQQDTCPTDGDNDRLTFEFLTAEDR